MRSTHLAIVKSEPDDLRAICRDAVAKHRGAPDTLSTKEDVIDLVVEHLTVHAALAVAALEQGKHPLHLIVTRECADRIVTAVSALSKAVR